MNKICLCMIVKNESKVIKRCLDSVLPIITSWCIVDTGSTDGTQDIIREHMSFETTNIAGRLLESDWKGFGASRTEAIKYAMQSDCDYLLFIDADDELVIHGDLPKLIADSYYITQQHGGVKFKRLSLVKTSLPWEYIGVVHEYIHSKMPYTSSTLTAISILGHPGDGARSANGDKFARDAEVLEAALLEEPTNGRYVFYLAQSYADSTQFGKALDTYRRRIEMGGWDEETYICYLRIARILEQVESMTNQFEVHEKDVVKAYLDAHQFRPTRAESLFSLSKYIRGKGQFNLSMLFADAVILIQIPSDLLFVEYGIYEWECMDEHSISAYWTGRYEDCRCTCDRLLAEGKMPEEHRPRVEENRAWAIKAIHSRRTN